MKFCRVVDGKQCGGILITMEIKPDRGYAYVILLASFVGHFIIYGTSYSMGVFYVEFREIFKDAHGSVALISSFNTAFLFFTSPVSSILTKRFGPQAICCIGGLVSATAYLLSVFASHIYMLYTTFGVLSGIGQGLSFIPVLTILGGYFDKRRTLAIGLAVSGSGLGNLTLSPLVQYFIELYGWRGSCLILSGIALNMCVIGLLLKPIPLLERTQQISKKPVSSCAEPDTLQEARQLLSNRSDIYCAKNNVGKCNSNSCPMSRKPNLKTSNMSQSFLDESDPQLKAPHLVHTNSQKGPFSHLDLFIFKNISFVLLCINNLFIYFGVMMTFTHLAAYGVTVGLSPYQGSLLLACIGIGNFSGRIIAAVLVNLPCVSEMCVFTGEFFVCGVLVAMIPHTVNFAWLTCISVAFGIIYGSMCAVLPQIIIHILDLDLLVSGYGYFSIFGGVGCLTGSPVAEVLFDKTGIYSASFYLAGAMLFVSSILMLYPWWNLHSKTNGQSQT